MILQCELDLAQLAGAANPAERGGRRGIGAAPTRARAAPRRMVRRIEHLHSELQRMSFGDPEVLRNGQIHVPDARANQIVAAAVAELPGERIAKRLPDE